jgi:hypothetical protein
MADAGLIGTKARQRKQRRPAELQGAFVTDEQQRLLSRHHPVTGRRYVALLKPPRVAQTGKTRQPPGGRSWRLTA